VEQKILDVQNLSKNFGGVQAIYDVSFQMNKGEIFGLIGPNGAGKTTLLNLLTGFLKPSAGKIYFQGNNITGRKPFYIARLGLIRTFQMTTVYKTSTVEANLLLGSHFNTDVGFWPTLLGSKKMRRKKEHADQRASELLKMFELEHFRSEQAGNLAYGHQKALGLAIAMASEPNCLLLDEPAAGMNPEETRWLTGLIRKINLQGISIILVEHDIRMVMSLSDQILVLNYGEKIAEGTPSVVQANEAVIKAYLGDDEYESA
jgi:branched-chain amino acid transport system ATP-binding protein